MALSQHFEGNLADIEITNGFNGYECFDDTFDDERAFEMEYEVSFNVQIILMQHLSMACDKFKHKRTSPEFFPIILLFP